MRINVSTMAAAAKIKKRKRVVLPINDKLDILKLLDKSVSHTVICEKYGIGRTTVGDIKRNREKILAFKKGMLDMGMTRKAKVMKLSDNIQLEKAVYIWFKQKRMEGVPISGPMLCEKAMQLSKHLLGEWRFCKRHGISYCFFPVCQG